MFDIMFFIVPIFIAIVFIFIMVMFFSPKARGKMISNQIKATKYMMDDSKDDIESISTNMTDATKEGIKTTVSAIKQGLTEDELMYCKYCGSKIDKDSTYCKVCGKEQ